MIASTSITNGTTSITVPCWNQVAFTRDCLRGLSRDTNPPWELIVVDNGSTDGTADFLAGVQAVGRVPVAVIRNDRNLGFPAAVNQGLEAARGNSWSCSTMTRSSPRGGSST